MELIMKNAMKEITDAVRSINSSVDRMGRDMQSSLKENSDILQSNVAENTKVLSNGLQQIGLQLANQQETLERLPSKLRSLSRNSTRAETSSRRGRSSTPRKERDDFMSNRPISVEPPIEEEPDIVLNEQDINFETEDVDQDVQEERPLTPLSYVEAEPRT
jgi:hypothetical protein